jgi:putative acyl-CoA dehydrogenase
LECFGGAGYVEDTGIPVLLRDSQVLTIWEGTTNVLSLDALRVLQREDVLGDLLNELRARIENVPARLVEARESVLEAVDGIQRQFAYLVSVDRAEIEACARDFAMELSRVVAGALLIEHAAWSLESEGDMRPVISAQRWCGARRIALFSRSKSWSCDSRRIAIDDSFSSARSP